MNVEDKHAGEKQLPFVAISDEDGETGSINAPTKTPSLSAEYTPATPPPEPPVQNSLPFEDDVFRPALYKSTGSAVTIGDSAIKDATVARGILLSSMLPVDCHFYDLMTDIPQVLDRAAQLHYV
ncbi:hypothetical protein MKW92_006405, partial [Papaver armeniacum]